MKIYPLLLLFAGCVKCQSLGPVVTTIPKPLIIIAGESNAGGAALNSSLTAKEAALRYSLKIFNNRTLTFQTLLIGTNNLINHQGLDDNATHGFENGLANSADSGSLGNTPVYILKAGTGSARIAWWNDSTIIYLGVNAWQQFRKRVDSAIILMRAINGGLNAPLYLFWTQGINNNIDCTNEIAWKDSTKSFFAKFRSRYGNNIPIIITYLPPMYSTYNASITSLTSEIDNCYAINVSDVTLNGDSTHWDYAGCKLIAARFVAIVRSHFKYY